MNTVKRSDIVFLKKKTTTKQTDNLLRRVRRVFAVVHVHARVRVAVARGGEAVKASGGGAAAGSLTCSPLWHTW